MLRVSVIIVSYNTRDLLRRCLKSLPPDVETFVVDNASTDGSADMVEQEFGSVNLIRNRVNLGFAAANNQAPTTGDVVLLLNPDAYLKDGAIGKAVAFLEAHPKCGICGSLMRNPEGGAEPSARDFPTASFKLKQMRGVADERVDEMQAVECDWVPGTCVFLRKAMLDEIGFFDERFYLYFEEIDLCFRAKKQGWKVFFFPGAEYEHAGGASSRGRDDLLFDVSASQLLEFRMRSEWLYFRKHYSLFQVLLNAGVEISWHCLRMLVNIRHTKKREACLAIVRAGLRSLSDTHFGKISPKQPW